MEWFQALDSKILFWLREALSCGFSDTFMPVFTRFGDNGFLWIAIAVILLLMGEGKKTSWRDWGIKLCGSLILTALVCNVVLKPLVGRARPYDVLGFIPMIPYLRDFSFPSGHTAAAFTSAAVLFAMNRKMGVVVYIFAVLMGISRLYVFVHFPSDVIGGALLGVFSAKIVMSLFDKMKVAKLEKM